MHRDDLKPNVVRGGPRCAVARRSTLKQTILEFPQWGGRRRGSGRKLEAARRSVAHRRRAPSSARFPLHVTLRLRTGLPTMRRAATRAAIVDALSAASARAMFRVVHYSVQSNHLH